MKIKSYPRFIIAILSIILFILTLYYIFSNYIFGFFNAKEFKNNYLVKTIERVIVEKTNTDIVKILKVRPLYKKNTHENMLDIRKDDNAKLIKNINEESLINKCNRVSEDYVPENLVKLSHFGYKEIFADSKLAIKWEELFEKSREEGVRLILISGYRSPQQQDEIYNEYKKIDSEWAKKFVAPRGYSEHQTGFAIDISDTEYNPEYFLDSPEGKFLEANAHKYGFILRYPRGKEKITGVGYESWHFRYVGVKLAKELKDKNITLEEYYKVEY